MFPSWDVMTANHHVHKLHTIAPLGGLSANCGIVATAVCTSSKSASCSLLRLAWAGWVRFKAANMAATATLLNTLASAKSII